MNRDDLHKRLIEVAAESPAKKRKVGAIIVFERPLIKVGEYDYTILAEGHNYNLSGGPCETEDNITHENVIHAEVSALTSFEEINLQDYSYGPTVTVDMLTLFTTHPPCDGCKAAMKAVCIKYEVMGDFLKFDSDKPRMSLVPSSLNIEVAKVLTYGAKKYKANNWRNTQDIERYINALERHLCAWKDGEDDDPESGLSHLSHIACNISFLIELQHLPRLQGE